MTRSGEEIVGPFLRLTAAITRSTRSVQSRTPTRSRQPAAERARRAASCNTRATRRVTSRRTTAARGTETGSSGGHSRTLAHARAGYGGGTCSGHRRSLPRRSELPLAHLALQAPSVALARLRCVDVSSGADEPRIASTVSSSRLCWRVDVVPLGFGAVGLLRVQPRRVRNRSASR